MHSHVAQRRDFHALEQRRRQAAQQFAAGEVLAAVARALRASRQSVSRWYRDWRRGGAAALRGAGRAGRKPQLDHPALERVDRALRQGARMHGFETELWTLPRVATVIERLTGVDYHPGHVWRVLRAMGWTLQRPTARARERNEAAVRRWMAGRWPAVKKTPDAGRPGSSSSTRVGSRNDRPSAGPGRREGRHRS